MESSSRSSSSDESSVEIAFVEDALAPDLNVISSSCNNSVPLGHDGKTVHKENDSAFVARDCSRGSTPDIQPSIIKTSYASNAVDAIVLSCSDDCESPSPKKKKLNCNSPGDTR